MNIGSLSIYRALLTRLLVVVLSLGGAGCLSAGEVRSEPLSVTQIIELSRQNVPDDEIIRQIQSAGTVYPMQASQLSALEKEGVSKAVIDYMQQTYLDAVRQDGQYQQSQYQHQSQQYEQFRYQQYQDRVQRDNYQFYGYNGSPYGWRYDQFGRRY